MKEKKTSVPSKAELQKDLARKQNRPFSKWLLLTSVFVLPQTAMMCGGVPYYTNTYDTYSTTTYHETTHTNLSQTSSTTSTSTNTIPSGHEDEAKTSTTTLTNHDK